MCLIKRNGDVVASCSVRDALAKSLEAKNISEKDKQVVTAALRSHYLLSWLVTSISEQAAYKLIESLTQE